MKKFALLILVSLLLSACATTTEEGAIGVKRKQYLFGVSANQVNQMALQNYAEVKQEATTKKTLDTNPEYLHRVQVVAAKIIPQTAIFRKDAPSWSWETHVITSPELNAYCMPGGKIVFYSGIIEKLKMTDGEIAAVMGHEVAHALREHGRERVAQGMAQQLGQQVGLGLLVASGKVDQGTAQSAAPFIDLGSQLLMTLPNSRGQESEADDIGVELMARAGYDPQEAVNLWKKMAAQGGGQTPGFLSTHPTNEKRITDIQGLIPTIRPIYLNTQKK